MAELTFPTEFALGAQFVLTYETVLMTQTHGREKAWSNSPTGRESAVVKREAFGGEDWRDLLAFFRTLSGPQDTFRVRNWLDYYAGGYDAGDGILDCDEPPFYLTGQNDGITTALHTSDVQYTDGPRRQPLGTGDGTTTVFYLAKTYQSPLTGSIVPPDVRRRIRRPIDGSVRIWINGTEVFAWTLQPGSGRVTFADAPDEDAVVEWAGYFDVPMRLDNPALVAALVTGEAFEWSSIKLIEVFEDASDV